MKILSWTYVICLVSLVHLLYNGFEQPGVICSHQVKIQDVFLPQDARLIWRKLCSAEHSFDLVREGKRVGPRLKVVHDLALLIEKELSKVPRNYLSLLFFFIEKFAVAAKVAIDRMSVGIIHIDLGHEFELGVHVVLSERFDLSISARLLTHELIAREGEDLESSIAELLVQLVQLPVVLRRQTSLGGHIHN